MKKNLLVLLLLVCGVITMNAQAKKEMSEANSNYGKVSSIVKSRDASTMVAKTATNFVLKNVEERSIAPVKAPTADLEALYYRPEGTLYQGMNPEGQTYLAGLILGKGYTDWKFLNASTGATSYEWTVNGNASFEGGNPLIVADAQGNGNAKYVGLGWSYVPQLKAKSGTQSDDYEYGFDTPEGNIDAFVVGCNDVYYLSSVDLSYMEGWYLQGGTSDYYFGTGVINGDPVESVGVLFEKPHAPLSALSMGAHIYSKSNNPLPAGEPLTLTIYPRVTNSEGNLVTDWGNPIISSEVYKEDLTPAFRFTGSTIQVYYARFGFAEYNEETGLETEIPLVLDGAFTAELSWDASKAFDFGVLFADAPHMPGNIGTSVIYAGEYQYALQDNGVNACDMAFGIEGLYNTLELDARIESISIPVGGGSTQVVYGGEEGGTYSNVIFLSSLQSDILELENDLPEWLSITEIEDQTAIEGGTEYFANAISLVFEGDALPAGTIGRKAEITLNSYGITSTITIVQGEVASGIQAVKPEIANALRQGDDFLLSYPASATSVSVYNVTGQRIGEYKLNASGKYTLPAAQLANGIYILKFNGTNTVVKVIK
jgi:hypothetical protein